MRPPSCPSAPFATRRRIRTGRRHAPDRRQRCKKKRRTTEERPTEWQTKTTTTTTTKMDVQLADWATSETSTSSPMFRLAVGIDSCGFVFDAAGVLRRLLDHARLHAIHCINDTLSFTFFHRRHGNWQLTIERRRRCSNEFLRKPFLIFSAPL